MMLARVAWRNLWRNPRRTLITLFSMVFGLTMMIVGYALMDGMLAQMVRYATLLGSGHVQIHHPEYLEDHSMYDTVPNPDKVLASVEGTHVGAAAPRIFATALASSGSLSAGARVWGIEPSMEAQVTELHRHLEKGEWIGDRPAGKVVLGRNLARTLAAGPGDEVILLTQAADGSLGNEIFEVSGVLKSIGEALDRGGIIMHRSELAQLLVLDDQIHEVAVRLKEPERLERSREAVGRALAGLGLEVKDWKQLFPEIDQYLGLSSSSMTIMLIIIFSIASLGIINTQLMALFERTREIGIMRALGLGPFPVAGLVLFETLYLTLLASAAGGALGALWSLRLEKTGWDISWIGGSFDFIGVAFDPHLYARLTPMAVFHSVIVMAAVVLVASVYPLFRAARISPVNAIGRGR